ncbi:MAG: hypothetical protein HFI37_03700 [Lachnospiraceae bacterium]|nr:hypothetical protein [Lachnospiraceae bacterium]
MHYEFYIDVYLFTNFFFDYLTLLLIREIRGKPCKISRMMVLAFLGVLSSTVCMLVLKNAWFYKCLVHFLINPLIFYGCFRQKSFREFILDYVTGYLLMMLVGGCVGWTCQVLGQTRLFGWVMAATAIFMSVFLALFQGGKEKEKIYDIKICQGESELSLEGFFDTGNLLVDPYVKLPVSLIAKEMFAQIEGAEKLAYRYIPFVSLGKEHGLIPAVTLDCLLIQKKNREISVKPAVFAVVEEDFLKNSEYQVILNGRLW